MRVFKRLISFLLVNLLVLLMLQFLLSPPEEYEQRILAFQEGDYHSLIIGTSYGQNLVPECLPDGAHTGRLSRPRVPLVDFTYMVKQLHKTNGLDRVYYDISVPYWNGELGEVNRVNMMKVLSGKERLEYFFRVLTRENYNDFFFRYELETLSVMAIPQTVRAKLDHLVNGSKSTVNGDQALMGDVDFTPTTFRAQEIKPVVLDAFRDLARFCRENDIELIGYVTAFPPDRLKAENQEDMHNYFTDLFAQEGLTLYDMNYVKWDYLPRTAEEYQDTDGHMEKPLAQRQSRLLSEILAAEDPAVYFETSYNDVLAALPD